MGFGMCSTPIFAGCPSNGQAVALGYVTVAGEVERALCFPCFIRILQVWFELEAALPYLIHLEEDGLEL